VIADPAGGLLVQPSGPAQLATAGSGDVLAGIAGALLAQGLAPAAAGVCAVWVHGHCARRANPDGPVRARDLLAALGPTIAELGTLTRD
ncbi:MAG: NAD(P)H-hydrate dehydratase, partial [Angustibacter sp.]